MKSICAILLLVGVALGNSTSFYAWKPDRELIYRFESQTLTGIPGIDIQYSGIRLVSNVVIQSFEDYTLRIKFDDPKYKTVNEKLIVFHGTPLVPRTDQPLPQDLHRFLVTPFEVHLKSGVVESFFVEKDEPVVITNIKRALLSQLQMDMTGTRRSDVVANHISKMTSSDQIHSYFSTYERTVVGDCETKYTINPLTMYQAREFEEQKSIKEKKLMELDVISGQKSRGREPCEGKNFYQIIKTKNFDRCNNMPIYQSASGIKVKCDFGKSKCSDGVTHSDVTRYVVCGNTREDFIIREAITKHDVSTNPIGWVNSEEKMNSNTEVGLDLMDMKLPPFTPMEKPQQTRTERSLIYSYSKNEQWGPNGANNQGSLSEEYGFEPILPLPDLHSGSKLFTLPLSMDELKSQVSQELDKIVKEIFSSPESCTSRSDISGSVSSISYYLRPLSYQQLKEVESSLHSGSYNPRQREIVRKLFMDILSMTASNPAIVLIKEKIERNELPERVAIKSLQFGLRNIKTPTQELMRELLGLVKSLENRRHLYNIAITQLSTLVNKVCVDLASQVANYPVRVYGFFCTKESDFVTKEYIPYLVQKLHHQQKEADRLVVIAGLGKIGHKDILLPLVNLIENKHTHYSSPMTRSVAVYMLKRLAKVEPSLIKPVLLALINNPAENTEVRIAAVSVLPWTNPTTADLQKMAVRSWFEPSKQVASFIYATLKNIVKTEVPELKPVALKAEGLMKTVKPFQYGIQFSQNHQIEQFVDYLRSASNVEISYVNTAENFVPSRFTFKSKQFGQSWEIPTLSFNAYTKGMDAFIDNIWQKLGYNSKVSSNVKSQLESISRKLNIKLRGSESPVALIDLGILGFDRLYSIDRQIYDELMEKVAEKVRDSEDIFKGGRNFNYTHTNYALEINAVGPASSGFPIVTSRNIPFVIGVKGQLEMSNHTTDTSLTASANLKVIPVVNAKIEVTMGAISPFSQEALGAGLEASLHLSMPANLNTELSTKGTASFSVAAPKEIRDQFEILHVFIKPFTFRKDLRKVESLTKSSMKTIMHNPHPQKYDKELGSNVGLKGHLSVETDYPVPYVSNVLGQIMKSNNLFSLASLPFPKSVRYSSFKVQFNPVQSSTKEIKAVFSAIYGVKSDRSSDSVMYFPRQEDISIEKKQKIEEVCDRKHPGSTSEAEQCKEEMTRQLESRRKSHEKAKSMLEETEEMGMVSGIHVETSLRSASSRRILNTEVIARGEIKGHEIRMKGDIVLSGLRGYEYEVNVNGWRKMPISQYRWNLNSLLEEQLECDGLFVAKYGKSQGQMEEIRIASKYEKSESQKRSVQESPEMEKCQEEIRKGRSLSPVCEEVRNQASSVNKITVKMSLPEKLRQSQLLQKLKYVLASKLWPLISVKQGSTHINGGQAEIQASAMFNRSGLVADIWLMTPSGEFEMKNLMIPRPIRGLFPLSVRNGFVTRLLQKISLNQAPASCRLDSYVKTFDNKTFEYQMNQCEHLLFKDCSSYKDKRPVAVLAQTESGDTKGVKILSSLHVIELSSHQAGKLGGNVYIKVDGAEINLSHGRPAYIKYIPGTKQVILEIFRSKDKVVSVRNPVEGLQVFFDGKKIEVVAPQSLRNRACGLCGDLNGENTADLKAPEQCVMSSPRLAGYSYILEKNGHGRCQGIPSSHRQQYEKDIRQCFKVHSLPTPLERLAKALLQNKLTSKPLLHIVEVQKNQICVSKVRVRSCSKNTKPLETRPQEISFTCLDKSSWKAQQILKMAKYGEQITEVLNMPTHFTRQQYVPTKCVDKDLPLSQQQNPIN